MTDNTARAEPCSFKADGQCRIHAWYSSTDLASQGAHRAAFAARPAGLREALDAWERNGAANRKSLAAFGLRAVLAATEPGLDVETWNAAITQGMRVVSGIKGNGRGHVRRTEVLAQLAAARLTTPLPGDADFDATAPDYRRAATEPPGLDVERASRQCSGKPVEQGGYGGCGCLCHDARLTEQEGT